MSADTLRDYKQAGFADSRIAHLLGVDESEVRRKRHACGVRPVYKRVDTCAAEFDTGTAYLYSCYDAECEAQPTTNRKIIILGGGPNRIGQGIEFDYCCVHAALSLREHGFETIMVNCNPETVSTDYDISDRLYFEPLTFEDVLELVELEKPLGVVVQYGGQTPLKLARRLEAEGVSIIGTSPDSIDLAEHRERFQGLINELGLKQPPNAITTNTQEALNYAKDVGYPLVVRPSYVLGGRAMAIVFNREELEAYMDTAVNISADEPLLLDHFLNDATEIDIDAVSDGEQVLIGGIMQHIEQAGIHSGDSACSLPPYSLTRELQEAIRVQVIKLAQSLNVIGLMNVQIAIKDEEIYILEVNPRASRTVPFVSKTTGLPLAKIAALCMVGCGLSEQGVAECESQEYFAVKEAVFPFIKFPGVDPVLGPEMRSTGEVMGVGRSFDEAFAKAQNAAGNNMPVGGHAFLSIRDADKSEVVTIGQELVELGFKVVATAGTSEALRNANISCETVHKVQEGQRPHIVDKIKDGSVSLIVNTTEGSSSMSDSYTIRREAVQRHICYTTTIAGAYAIVRALKHREEASYSLQEIHSAVKPRLSEVNNG